MEWKFNSKLPIYTQLVEQMRIRIVTGYYPPGSRLSSVRELAAEAGVNPNTMQRAFAELESIGLVHAQRTAGRFITEDNELIAQAKKETANRLLEKFTNEMKALGFEKEEILKLLEEYENE